MKVSVLMPVYNCEKYIKESIDSILNQEFKDFELIIINDGSTDQSKEIISSIQDDRIRYFDNEKNLGLPKTLNKGLLLCQGEYIARMDADDISVPTRFLKQVNYLDSHPQVGILGAWYDVIDSTTVYQLPASNSSIKVNMLFNCMMCHPVVMMRRSFLEQFSLRYDETIKYAEDYDLWVRAQRFFELANLQEVLLHYRMHENQTRVSRGHFVHADPVKTKMFQIRNFVGEEFDSIRFSLHESILQGTFTFTSESFQNLSQWLKMLGQRNERLGAYDAPVFLKYLFDIWFMGLIKVKKYNMPTFFYVFRMPFFSGLTVRQKLSFLVKCLLNKTQN